MFYNLPEYNLQVGCMSAPLFRFDDHVIHVNLQHVRDLIIEDFVHPSLVCLSIIFEVERHNLVTKFLYPS